MLFSISKHSSLCKAEEYADDATQYSHRDTDKLADTTCQSTSWMKIFFLLCVKHYLAPADCPCLDLCQGDIQDLITLNAPRGCVINRERSVVCVSLTMTKKL